MELSNRKKISLLILIVIAIIFAGVYIRANLNNKPLEQKTKINKIQKLLLKADSSIGISPELAEKNALDALHLSLAENHPNYIIQSWIILGKIKQIAGENDTALSFFSKAKLLSTQNSFYKELGIANMKMGEIIYDHGNYDSALTYFIYTKKIADSFNIDPVKTSSLYYIGKYNETKGNFEIAKNYYDQALEICRKNKDYGQLAIILPSRGKNYISEGKLNLALKCYLEAYQLSEQLNDKLLYAETSSHLGGLYLQMEQYDKALEYDKKALIWRSSLNNPEGIAKSYNNIGKAYTELKKLDSAFYYFNESLTFCEKINYKKGIIKSLTNIGKTYFIQGKYNVAIEFLTRAIKISVTAGYNIGIAESSLVLANIYKNSHQTDKAIEYYLLSLSKIKTTNYDDIKEGIYKGLFDCYSSVSNYKLALENHILLLETEMKLLNVENKRQLALLNIAFDTERKDKDNEVLRTDNEIKELLIKRKNILMWLIIVALGFMLVLCLNIYNRLYANKKANKILGELNQKITNQNIELAKLNKDLENANREKDKLFTIISHELRNPLYWFQNLAEVLSNNFKKMSEDKIQKSLSALDESAKNAFHLMDNLLQWSRSKLNRIHPKKSNYILYDLISDTLEMYQSIFEHKELEFYNGISSEIVVYADADLLCCVIRNLISNAIKYTPTNGHISINCSRDNDFITIVVSDSGVGIPDYKINRVFIDDPISMTGLLEEKGSGLGLKLCKDFVELNGGTIWAKSNKDSGTSFYFTVPAICPKEIKEAVKKIY